MVEYSWSHAYGFQATLADGTSISGINTKAFLMQARLAAGKCKITIPDLRELTLDIQNDAVVAKQPPALEYLDVSDLDNIDRACADANDAIALLEIHYRDALAHPTK